MLRRYGAIGLSERPSHLRSAYNDVFACIVKANALNRNKITQPAAYYPRNQDDGGYHPKATDSHDQCASLHRTIHERRSIVGAEHSFTEPQMTATTDVRWLPVRERSSLHKSEQTLWKIDVIQHADDRESVSWQTVFVKW
jgi:hypothetical protein